MTHDRRAPSPDFEQRRNQRAVPADDPIADARTVAEYVRVLSSMAPDRRPGGTGNRGATSYAGGVVERLGWHPTFQEFDCLDWEAEGGSVTLPGTRVEVVPSPYGTGVDSSGPIRIARELEHLAEGDLSGSILIVTGNLAAEPLTPKHYPFYGNEHHATILEAMERADPAAVIAVTGRNPALCGSIEPFPLIEDGDFPIATANIRPDDAEPLMEHSGETAHIEIRAARRPSRSCNVTAHRGPETDRVVVMAHIDSKPGTPGAVDNACGPAILFRLAELLSPARHPNLPVGVELLVVNGEDHYAAPGEVAWLEGVSEDLEEIALAINIDGAGHKRGQPSYSAYNLDEQLNTHVERVFARSPGVAAGPAWYQSDHAIFAMRGRPALAITSEPIAEFLESVFHSPTDTADQVDPTHLLEIAAALADLIATWPHGALPRTRHAPDE